MILLSNNLLKLPEFRNTKGVVIRINMAHVKDRKELEEFVDIKSDIFLDYPKGRTKPPTPTLHIPDALEMMLKYPNIKYFAVSNIETPSEVKMLNSYLPDRVSFIPKIETLKGVLNLESILRTKCIKHIMLDSEDLYTDSNNDIDLYLHLKSRVLSVCREYDVEVLELHGVIFKSEN